MHERAAGIDGLYYQAAKGDPRAMESLSAMAGFGNQTARERVDEIDRNPPDFGSSAGESVERKRLSRLRDLAFVVRHPLKTMSIKMRQSLVGLDIDGPPHTSTHEEFIKLSARKAAGYLKLAGNDVSGGVPKWAWTKKDQERMDKGERPEGIPLHPDV